MDEFMTVLYKAQDATTEADHSLRRAKEALCMYVNLVDAHNAQDRIMAFNEAAQLINEVLIWLRQQPGHLRHQ